MMRKFRKIFRPTTTISTATKNENIHSPSSPESTSDETSYVKQVSSSINKQLFTGRQNEFFHTLLFSLLIFLLKSRFLIKDSFSFMIERFFFSLCAMSHLHDFVICLFFGTKCI